MKKMNTKKKLALAVAASALVVAGCGGSDDDQPIENGFGGGPGLEINSERGAVRVFHASPDAPEVNVLLNEQEAITSLDYRESSGFQTVAAGEYDIAVEGIVPAGNVRVINVENFEVPGNTRATVIAVDTLNSIEPLVVPELLGDIAANQVGVQVVHAAPIAEQVDVYVTAPGESIEDREPSLSFDFKQSVDVGALDAGTVQIRVTLHGSKEPVFDSGAVDLAGFAGSKVLLAAVNTTTAVRQAASPIQIIAIADNTTLPILDIESQAGVQIVHASPDAGAAASGPVEVFAASAALGENPVEIIDGFRYLEVFPTPSALLPVPAAADYSFSVAPDTDTIADAVFSVSDVTLASGADYTVVASGRVGGTPGFGLILAENDTRSIATQAQLNVIHGAAAAGDVDVFVTPAGTLSIEQVLATAPSLDNFSYGSITGNIDLSPGLYDIRVFAGSALAINVEGVNLEAGSVTTAVARGPLEPNGIPEDFGLIVLSH